MSNIPKLRTPDQILGDLIDGFLSRQKEVNDLNKGSVLMQFFEAIAQSNFRASADIIAMIDALSVDRAQGEALQRLARDKNVPILSATFSTGTVSITDLSFKKIQTNIYAGQPAPVAGSLTIYVSDASEFPATGSIYIGRGTINVEGPLEYTAVTPQGGGAYYELTLSPITPTTKFHNIGENVTLSRGGNRVIPAGSIVQTAQSSNINTITFKTTAQAVILDGEVTVTDVPVQCERLGTIGNIPKGAIREILGTSFPASATNEKAFSNGRAADTDEDIRIRIKAYEQAKSKGTERAIQLAAVDVVAPDELKKVQSSSIVRYADNSAALVFDDGTGYEPLFTGAGYEIIVDEALGGEKELQLRLKPIAQSRLKNEIPSPYPIEDLSYLAVEINGELRQHQFKSSEFKVPSSATAFEIASSINGNPNLHFLASTANGGKNVVIYPKDRKANDILVVKPTLGSDANIVLGFPTRKEHTLRLYKNDKPLNQDGVVAKVSSRIKSSWSPSIAPGDTLSYVVDNTPEITITLNNSDFQVHDITATVSYLTDIEIWKKVLNAKMSGVEVVVNGEVLDFISNRKNSNEAYIEITGGTLKDKIFSVGENLFKSGKSPDFTLNKQTGQISLVKPLSSGDKLTAGSDFTRASMLTGSLPNGVATAGRSWIIVDGDVRPISTDLQVSTNIMFTKSGTKLTITAQNNLLQPEGFADAKPGDWLLVWANPTDPAALISNQGFWRIESVQVGQIIVDDGVVPRSNLGIFFNSNTNRFKIVRSKAPIQLLDFGVNSLIDFAKEIQQKIVGVETDIVGDKVRIATKNYSESGQLYVVASDANGDNISLPVGEIIDSVPSHYGYVVTSDSEAGMPSFTHGTLGTAITDKVFNEPDYENIGGDRDDFVEILDKYDNLNLRVVPDSNANRRSFVKKYDPTLQQLTLIPPPYMEAGKSVMQAGDRYFLRDSFKFDSNDRLTVIVDGDSTVKSFSLPVARRIKVSSHSTPTTQDFSATDLESSLPLKSQASFGPSFSFDDFKIYRQAQETLSDGVYSIKFKAVDFGDIGNKIRVGISYPDDINKIDITHKISASELLDINLILPISASRTPTWDHTSCFTTSVVTTGGKDTITYTWRTGTEPDFTLSGSDLNIGDIVIIKSASDFLAGNKGIVGKVTAFTATSFTVEVPTQSAVSDNISFSNIVNQSGIITVTTPVPHNITANQRIGIWNTVSHDNVNYPMNRDYIATPISANVFTVPTPSGVPGGNISAASHTSNVVTVTSNSHNLNVGNVILISGVGVGSYDGIAVVHAVLSPNQFQYIRPGSSSSIGSLGRFDYQSYGNGASVPISSISKSGYTVTVTSPSHGLSAGQIVNIQSVTIDAWNISTTYNPGDIVREGSLNYVAIAITTGDQPSLSPTKWQVTSLDLTGKFIINSTTTNTFTYTYHQSGNTSGTGGSATLQIPQGSLARAVGGLAGEYLAFGEASATAQEIVDYVASKLSNKISAELITNGIISSSTADNDISSNYLTGSITQLKTYISSRKIKITVNNNVKAGSNIKISGLVGSLSVYNGNYVVLENVELTPTSWELTLYSSILASNTTVNPVSASYVGYTPSVTLKDGVNSVSSTDLNSLISTPMFVTKTPWKTAPAIDEELRLVACTNDHLIRFWNKTVVTGLSNVAKITDSEYGRQIQISSKKFGGLGSVQVSGGTSNKVNVAILGSASTINNKFGVLNIPYEIRKGLINNQWIKIQNSVRQNKDLNFSTTTTVKVYSNGLEITGGTGTFQTLRPTTQAANTVIKIEKHGKFMAVIRIGGASFGLATGGVKEGDWVRFKNNNAPLWSNSTTYSIGQRAYYNGRNYTSLQNGNLNNIPSSSPTFWRIEEFSPSNEGIYQVVRTFGEDSFWIEAPNAVEEILVLGDPANMRFYSYDSAMPGDTLVISTDILGATNVGRYKIVDESYGVGYQFPTATRIYTTLIPTPTGSITLGGSYAQVGVEEKNPTSLWKRIFAIGAGSDSYASILTDSPELTYKISSSLGAYLTAEGKLNLSENINYGLDAYKYYNGLIKQLNRVIYGDPADFLNYPGVRAAGTDIDIRAAIIKRIKIGVGIRIRSGVPFSEIRERVKSAIAGYINTLGVGEQVSLSKVVSSASSINGVIAVAVTYPTYDASNDLIHVGSDEKALVVDPTTDVSVSILGT